jgi:hypothetical protein
MEDKQTKTLQSLYFLKAEFLELFTGTWPKNLHIRYDNSELHHPAHAAMPAKSVAIT